MGTVGHQQTRRTAFHGLVGASAGMQEVYRQIDLFAPADVPVVITGETGTGKGLAARALHELAGPERPFVDVNCAQRDDDLVRSRLFGHRKGAFTGAVEDRGGMLARADGGVLFLDEVAELSLDVQAMLLKALEEGRYRPVGSDRTVSSDFRLVAATNRDLAERVDEGAFRDDLRYRLGMARIHLPPVREREGDVPLLAREFLCRYGDSEDDVPEELTPDAIAALEAFHWPGNVRQLQQAVRTAAVHARGEPTVGVSHVREALWRVDAGPRGDVGGSLDLERLLATTERRAIRTALERTGGHRERTAELLGIGVSTLYRKLSTHENGGPSGSP